MLKIVAFCSYFNEFKQDRILNFEYAEHFPGALWVPLFAQKLRDCGIVVATGDRVLELVNNQSVLPHEVYVVNEMDSPEAVELVQKGALPGINFCFESMLYVPELYQNFVKTTKDYLHSILFEGAFAGIGSEKDKQKIYYPSYSPDDIVGSPLRYEDKKFACAVVSNKYLRLGLPESWGKRSIERFKCVSPVNLEFLQKNELQTKRLEYLAYFSQRGDFALYGKGWDKLDNLPPKWRSLLSDSLNESYRGKCENKLQTIKNYKFTLCLENLVYPGYVTEKIIDCLVAGTVPLYLGAPDIENFVAGAAFIDLRDYASPKKLYEVLLALSESEYNALLEHGREFLRSENGLRYTYQWHADSVFELIINDWNE